MTMVWRKLKRTGHEASRFRFHVALSELIIDTTDKKPEKVAIACMHRRRRYSSATRNLEKSFSHTGRSLIVWPEVAADTIDVDTTLFKDPNKDQYDSKEWTLIVEETTAKGKTRALAAIALNLCFFVNQNPDVKTELKLKLRPLQKHVSNCTLSLVLSSILLKSGVADDPDLHSNASSTLSTRGGHGEGIIAAAQADPEIAASIAKVTKEIDDWHEEKTGETVKPTPPPVVRVAWGEPAPAPETLPSTTASVPPPLPPHRRRTDESVDSPTSSAPPAPIPEPLERRQSAHSVIKSLPPVPPEIIEDECLLDWCKRVTKDYKPVKIADFTKSFRNGLAFCAILHRYDPSLIGPFEDLDFSSSKLGHKKNCEKAFVAAASIGVDPLNSSEVTTYPDEKSITIFLSKLRASLLGQDWVDNALEKRKSEYRISMFYSPTESELNVVRQMEQMRLARSTDETDWASSAPPKLTQGTVKSRIKVTTTIGETDSTEVAPAVSEKVATPVIKKTSVTVVPENPTSLKRKESVIELEEHEKFLTKMADEMKALALSDQQKPVIASTSVVNGTSQPTSSSPPDEENDAARQRLEEARKYLENATNMATDSHERHASTDYLKQNPSTSSTTANPRDARLGQEPSNRFLDRATRYGSMRSFELAEALAAFVAPVLTTQTPVVQQPSSSTTENVEATPTRKIVTKFEKSVIHVADITGELAKISQRLVEIEGLDQYVEEKIRALDPESAEYGKLVTEKIRLLDEKDALVRKQDYFNVAAELSEVTEQISILEPQLNEVTQNSDDTYKTEDEKQRIDALVEEYKNLINRKNELALELVNKEGEEEDHQKRSQDTLKRSQNFARSTQEPLNASRRIMNWIRSTTAS